MQGTVDSDMWADVPIPPEFEETELERRGKSFDMGAPVTGAVAVGDRVAVGFGDGKVRFFEGDKPPVSVGAHKGVILCLVANGSDVLTGGEDGRFLRVSPDGTVEEIANFGSKWVDCVTAAEGLYACSSGRTVHVWSGGKAVKSLEHESTVGGLAVNVEQKSLAVSHYGGVTLWNYKADKWTSSKLEWKGSHGEVNFSPDGKFIVTAMQEMAVHVWRMLDRGDLEMSGYPTKVKSFAWVGDKPHLATSGASEAICWPFDGENGPMRRSPICVSHRGEKRVTVVQDLPGEEALFVGFHDGAVLLAELLVDSDALILRRPNDAEVTAMAVTESRSHIFIGDASGQVLWSSLYA
ncbi:WD40 repeat domain-containing protein [Veronia pacifica]|uniref:Anaphase-promoting complex subunit 4 WD40 domain-containing protein n=1 Tax=Veronia pacifica TaxID=1080227 RepID=A0A1C3ESB8_9GAMM|nr:WD40 repeat domain-containing protein [Veronia pacifica]ODA36105.1 hypothetical protein A8L45_00425 [Veronia pacifica]